MSDARRDARADVAAEKARTKAMRPWYKKKRFLIPIGLVVLIGIAAAAGGGDDAVDKANDAAGEVTRNGTDGGDKLFPGRPDSKSADIERNIGQSAELSGYTATVTNAGFQGEVSDFENKGYLVADVTITNRDDDAQPYNTFEWKLITPGGQIIDPTFTSTGQLGSGDLVKGGTVSGKIVWEVGNQKGDFFVIYDPADFGDERAVWKATI